MEINKDIVKNLKEHIEEDHEELEDKKEEKESTHYRNNLTLHFGNCEILLNSDKESFESLFKYALRLKEEFFKFNDKSKSYFG